MPKAFNPTSIRAPFAQYSHGMEVEAGSRLVFCSGQLGVGPDDYVPDEAGAQSEICFSNIAAILAEAEMSLADVININAFVTDRAYMADYMAVRDRLFSEPYPASTLMIVSGFTREIFKVEVQVIAAG